MKDTPVSTGPRLPTQELKPFNPLFNVSLESEARAIRESRFGTQVYLPNHSSRVAEAAQQLVALAECLPDALPEPLVASLANLHAALAGPGPSALDARPQSLEIIGDEGLHAKAMAEAKAREMGRDAEITRAIEALPAEVRHAAEGYDTLRAAHQEELFLSYQQGKDAGYDEGYLAAMQGASLWRIAKLRFQAWRQSWN